MTVVLTRVDNRLIHGQVLEAWIPKFEISTVIVVDDGIAEDPLRQSIMEIAVPSDIDCMFVRTDQLKVNLERIDSAKNRILVLFSGIRDIRDVLRMGVPLGKINLGNIHYKKGKSRVTPCISLNDDEIAWLTEIGRRTQIEIQALPDDSPLRFPDFIGLCGGKHSIDDKEKWWNRLLRKIS